MIYLKRFLYTLIMIILCILVFFIVALHLALTPIGILISFILTADHTRYFNLLEKLEEYTKFIDDKLESIFLK